MALSADFIPPITAAERDFKSPISEDLMQKYDEGLEMLQDFITSNGLGLLKGTVDVNPPNASPSYIQDANPTVGRIDRTDKFKDARIKMTSGAASGKTYVVISSDATNKRIGTTENLFAEGILAGDSYRIMGHTHDDIGSEAIAGVTGVVHLFGGTSAPGGFLLCDGASYLRTTYPSLFSVIGTAFGAADGTHFNVPNMMGRVAVGTGAGSGLTSRTLAAQGGHELLQAHSHTIGNTANIGDGGANRDNALAGVKNLTSETGGGDSQNMQPFTVLTYIIKT